MQKPQFKIVLVSPEIPWNTGAIGRTCVALNLELIIIKPTIIDLSDKALKRAGLDYWRFVQIKQYESWDEFMKAEDMKPHNLFFFSTKATKTIYEAEFYPGAALVFGSESKGLPSSYHENYHERMFIMPMYSDNIRSLNLANTATAAAFEAVRQLNFSR